MVDAYGSNTARIAAANRAAHTSLDEPVILADSVARALAGDLAEEVIAEVTTNPMSNLGRFHFAARARWAEDTLHDARSDGVDQYVLLGAGLDSFAYRRGSSNDRLRIFEVDHPATQTWKRHRLTAAGIVEPETVIFVPVDFEVDDFEKELVERGFRTDSPSVVAWLGVTYYLQPDTNEATLARLARWAPTTRVVLDYRLPESVWDSFEAPWNTDRAHAAMRATAESFRAAGEPWLSYFSSQEIEQLVRRCGFRTVEHLDHIGVRRKYMNFQQATLPGPAPYTPLLLATV